ncbi:MAG: glucosaminidase domain-containing protein, partial [Chitinophagaceae bacterium]|nr:glucosaminidase domain-containing protein [Chitinophagaceae bacterium]
TYKWLAVEEMKRTGVPAAITLAQGIHETSAGKSVLVQKSNNHFGIKCKSYWTGQKVSHDDDARGECFRKYDSAILSYRDHSDFLRAGKHYAFLFDLDPTDYKAWAYGLKKAGYATNPKYAPVLIKLIEDYNLEQYTLIAMGKMSPSDEVVASLDNRPKIDIPMIEVPTEAGPDERPAEVIPAPQSTADDYPTGEFYIENTRVVYAKQGTSLLSIAQEYDIPLNRLLNFNNMKGQDVLFRDQLIFLQKKKKASR